MNFINKKSYFIIAVIFCMSSTIFAQEALKSTEEDYFEFLSLTGETDRPTLGYRTLSDSVWTVKEDSDANVWGNNNLGTTFTLFTPKNSGENWYLNGINQSIKMRIYGPEWFNSYNTAAPYGQNDGALWQGRGYNTSLTAGIRFEGYGIEATFKPQLSFSQNLSFEIMNPSYVTQNNSIIYDAYDSQYGYIWAYGKNIGVDAPQRFGDKAFFTFDFGDTEIRYTWHTFTIGFGTQAIWLGPAKINPILHSNNAATYPKVDIGLRKTEIHLPWLNWYIGDIEARLWTGYLSESDYFDNDDSNNHNMINAFTFSYAPSFLPGLTLTANRIFQTKWSWKNLKYIGELFFISLDNSNQVQGNENQMASISVAWNLPESGFQVYAEVGIDDYVPGKLGLIRYPFHTMVWTAGLAKDITINKEKQIYGILSLEVTELAMSQDFQFQWPYNFYFHHQVSQGYTNKGQCLGAGNGAGGNSQYLSFELYYPKGSTLFYIHRSNPDNNFLYRQAVNASAGATDSNGQTLEIAYFTNWKTSLAFGITTNYFITSSFSVQGGFVYNLILNPLYNNNGYGNDIKWHNIRLEAGLKYNL